MPRTAAAYRALAPAKINLGLFVGPTREQDGRHELVSVMQSISLADELTLAPATASVQEDEVLCPGLAGENLAAAALRAFRAATGWDAPAQRLTIEKRIPVAAGLAGGSADAAAALRLARAASGLGDERLLHELACELGADVPAQIAPGRWLTGGAGERLTRLPAPERPLAVLLLPPPSELSTAAVFAELDRMGEARTAAELLELEAVLRGAYAHGAPLAAARELLHNDLQRPAAALCPEIVGALRRVREAAGAVDAFVSGSGPTVVAVFVRTDGSQEAQALAHHARLRLGEAEPRPLLAMAVAEEFGAARPLAEA
jgi:4-diphosphocytidyl-2-C-methyl-D-erythritol kinase